MMEMKGTHAAEEAEGDVKIWFGVLGTHYVSCVKLKRSALVADLRDRIAVDINVARPLAHASDLKLYMPRDLERQNEAFKADEMAFVGEGRLSHSDFKIMSLARALNSESCFGPALPATSESVQVFVKLPTNPFDRRSENAVSWQYSKGDFERLPVSDNDAHVTIPARYLQGSGIVRPPLDMSLVLFRREDVDGVWSEIRASVMDFHAKLYIVGPLGCGKSCAAFAFACSHVDRSMWRIVWICASPVEHQFLLVLLNGNRKATATLSAFDMESILQMLRDLESASTTPGAKILVFLDEYEAAEHWCHEAERLMSAWHLGKPKTRRFVCVARQATLAEWDSTTPQGQVVQRACQYRDGVRDSVLFGLASWTLQEYLAAVEIPSLASTVEAVLRDRTGNGPGPIVKPLAELVCGKFFVVGGNARYMFRETTAYAKELLQGAIKWASKPEGLLEGVTDTGWASYLVALYKASATDHTFRVQLVSMYAAHRIVAKLEKIKPAAVMQYATVFGFDLSRHDQLVQNWFSLALVTSGIRGFHYDLTKCVIAAAPEVWQTELVHFIAPCRGCRQQLQPGWNVPGDLEEAGFDAVYRDVDPTSSAERVVFFVGMVGEETYTYQFSKLQEWLQPLGGGAKHVDPQSAKIEPRLERVELRFVVPLDVVRGFVVPRNVEHFERDVIHAVGPCVVRTGVWVVRD